MNTYERFLFVLRAEFTLGAHSQFGALWTDLEELERATDEQARAQVLQRVHRRIRTLSRAAHAANVHEVQVASQILEHVVAIIANERTGITPELIQMLYQSLTRLAEELYTIETQLAVADRNYRPAETVFAEHHAN